MNQLKGGKFNLNNKLETYQELDSYVFRVALKTYFNVNAGNVVIQSYLNYKLLTEQVFDLHAFYICQFSVKINS